MAPAKTILLLPVLLSALACQGAGGPELDPGNPGDGDGDGDGDPEPPEPCELSALGAAVHTAAMASAPGEHSVVASTILSFDNGGEEALLRGGEIFTSMGDLIAEAEESVGIAMFVWEVDSDPHRAILGGLRRLESRLASEGRTEPVVVRIVSNVIALSEDSAEVGEALRRSIDTLSLDPSLLQVTVATRSHNGLDAMHHKLLVVDGRVAHLGGANVEAVHNWQGAVPWHDSAYVVKGEVAATLNNEFANRWSESEAWSCDAVGCASAPTERFYPELAGVGVGDCTPMIALVRRPAGWVNNDIDNPQDLGYLAAFSEAKSVIKVQSPNLNDDAAVTALIDAAIAGVRVELLLSFRFNELAASLPGQGGGNGKNVDEIYATLFAELGEERACQVLDARWFSVAGVVVDGNVAGASHLKYTSVDDQVTFVGSMNMDTQSWNNSGEVTVAIDDRDVNAAFDSKIFDPYFATATPSDHCLPWR